MKLIMGIFLGACILGLFVGMIGLTLSLRKVVEPLDWENPGEDRGGIDKKSAGR